MLGKLLKYDLRSMLKSFLLIWGGALVIALINHFTLNADGRLTGLLEAFSTLIPLLVYVGILIAMVVLTLLFIIQRFYNGLLRDEGYLMFTLPVRPWQLITSKGISAVIVTAISSLVGVASIMLLVSWSSLRQFLSQLFSLYGDDGYLSTAMKLLFTFEALVLIVFSLGKSIYQVYAAIALGHLFRRHRVGMAFLMYILISVVVSVLASVGFNAVYHHADEIGRLIQSLYLSGGTVGSVQAAFGLLLLVTLAQLAIFHVITERILNKKLNLE